MHSCKRLWQGEPLSIDFAHLTDHPKDHRWQRTPSRRMVMLARTVLQTWTPKGGDIGYHRFISFVFMSFPLRQAFHMFAPEFDQNNCLPDTFINCCPGSAHGRILDPDSFQRRKQC